MVLLALLQNETEQFIQTELVFVILLSIAALVAIFVRRFIRLPYTVALVLVGLVLSLFPDFLQVPISSNLILAILVPPLVFEASLHIGWRELRNDIVPILLLAVAGVALSTLIVSGIISQLLPEIPLTAALAFGALISATDPVAVVAFFRSLGVNKRLALLVEGESLLNDGVAIVIFGLAVGLIETPALQGAALLLGPGPTVALAFLKVAVGGLLIGVALGFVVSEVILRNVDDALVETAVTLTLAFGAYVVAEEFHVSGILAVVAAGLFVGNIGSQNTSPTTQVSLDNFWEFMAFVANSLVFLLIGLRIAVQESLPVNVFPIVLAVLAVLLSRALVVYTMTGLNNWLNPRAHISMPYRHVIFWGGLRGAISLALALTLDDFFPAPVASELQVMTFGVVLFTLLGQGTTISGLLRRLNLGRPGGPVADQQRQQALLYATQAGKRELDRLREEGILSATIYQAIADVYDSELQQRNQLLRTHLLAYPELELEMVLQAREDTLRAERSAIADVFRRGLVSQEIYDELLRLTDNRRAALNFIIAERGEFLDPAEDDNV
jgi:monovalent cation:H+ antiporter, CPA1 family